MAVSRAADGGRDYTEDLNQLLWSQPDSWQARERERAHDAHSALVDSEECSDNSREVRNASGNIHGLDRAVYKSCRPR